MTLLSGTADLSSLSRLLKGNINSKISKNTGEKKDFRNMHGRFITKRSERKFPWDIPWMSIILISRKFNSD